MVWSAEPLGVSILDLPRAEGASTRRFPVNRARAGVELAAGAGTQGGLCASIAGRLTDGPGAILDAIGRAPDLRGLSPVEPDLYRSCHRAGAMGQRT